MGDADDLEMDDLEMDDNGGVQSAADASRAAKDAEAAALEAVNAKANARAAAKVGVTGTAAKVGVTFFAHLIEVLAGLTQLRGPLPRAAADASLALWALAWQPSNRRSMSGEEVIAPLVALYALEGERFGAAGRRRRRRRRRGAWRLGAPVRAQQREHRIRGPHAREAAGEAPAGRQRSRITGIELGIELGRRRRRARRESFRLFARSVFLRGARGREKDAKRTRGTERPGRASERVDVPKHPADHLGAARRRRHRARVAAQVRPSEARQAGTIFYITTHENVKRPMIKMTVLASRVDCQVFALRAIFHGFARAPRGRADAGGVSPETVPRVRHRAPRLSRHRLGSARGGRRHRVRRGAARRARAGPHFRLRRRPGPARDARRPPRSARAVPEAPARLRARGGLEAHAREGYVRVPRDAEAKTARRNRGGARAAARSGTSEEGPSSMNAAKGVSAPCGDDAKTKTKPIHTKGVGSRAFIQVLALGTDVSDTSPSVLLFTDSQRIVFNVGEGFQRFAVEHGINIRRLNRVCLTSVSARTTGGLTGMLLTMADGVTEHHEDELELKIHGPPRTERRWVRDAFFGFFGIRRRRRRQTRILANPRETARMVLFPDDPRSGRLAADECQNTALSSHLRGLTAPPLTTEARPAPEDTKP